MAGNSEHGRYRSVISLFTRQWTLWSIAALLIFISFSFLIWWTGMTWLPSLVVAVIALAGYAMSNRQYREQEARKYRPALTASFQLASDEVRHNLHGWMPGFNLTFEGPNPVLQSNFTLENISASPIIDVCMNFYMHDFREDRKPEPFFERDVVVADGIAGNSHSVFAQVLRSHRISQMGENINGVKWLSFNFHQLFLSLIPSVKPGEPAHLSAWSLVFKYKNLLGESFFSVYKMEGPVVRQESSRMVFYGSFEGDYLIDNDDHGFVNNRGFPSKEDAPNWDNVRESVEAAMRDAKSFISTIDSETYCK